MSRRKPTIRRKLQNRRLFMLFGGMLLVAGLLYVFHAIQYRRQASYLLEVARSSRTHQDYEKAASFYKLYLEFRKNDVEAYSEYAHVTDELADNNRKWLRESIRLYETVLAFDQGRHEDRWHLVKLYMQTRQFGKARDHLNALLTGKEPSYATNPDVYDYLALCDLSEGKIESALNQWRKAIATGKASPQQHLTFARRLRGHDPSVKARAEADKAMNDLVDRLPNDLDARMKRFAYRTEIGERFGAGEDIRYAYANIPAGKTNIEVILEYARFQIELDWKLAKGVLEEGLKTHPGNVPLSLSLADALIRGGERAAAGLLLKDVAASLPSDDFRLVQFADRLVDLDQFENAQNIINRLKTSNELTMYVQYLDGRIAMKRGNWPVATPLLKASIPGILSRKDYRHVFKAHMGLGTCATLAFNPAEQEKQYRAALKYDRNHTFATLGLARSLVQLQREKEAGKEYQSIMITSLQARVEYAVLKFEETIRLPELQRDWSIFETACGPREKMDVVLEPYYAQSLVLRKRTPEAIKYLEDAIATSPNRLMSWIKLAFLRAGSDLDLGIRTLTEAQQKLGDKVELRIARSQLLASLPKPNVKDIAQLGEDVQSFDENERYQLHFNLGELLDRMGDTDSAVKNLKAAAALKPFDIKVRFTLFELANRNKLPEVREATMAEIRKLDGDTGAVTVVCEAIRLLASSASIAPEQREVWRTRIREAANTRSNWSRLQLIAGDFAYIDNRMDDALKHYLQAIELNDTSESLVRRAVEMLFDRSRIPEAVNLLTRLEARGMLSEEMQKRNAVMRAATGLDRDNGLSLVREKSVASSRDFRVQLARYKVFTQHGQLAEARVALQLAKSLNDIAPLVWISIVRFLMATGDPVAALAQAEQAEKRLRDPKSASHTLSPTDIARTLGICRYLVGDDSKAIAEFEIVTKANPDDLNSWQFLYDLQRKSNRQADADRLLSQLAASSKPEQVFWARRVMALTKVSGPQGFREQANALELVNANLQENPESLEDKRAKGMILMHDPFTRKQGLDLMLLTQATPFNAEQNGFLAKYDARAGDVAQSIDRLKKATVSDASAEHLTSLANLQTKSGDLAGSEQTINRLKIQAPGAWPTVVEEARWLAKKDKSAEAAKLLKDFKFKTSQADRTDKLTTALIEIGDTADAEELLREYAKNTEDPTSHAPLASFLIQQDRHAEALALIQERQAKCPAPVTGSLYLMLAQTRPLAAVVANDRMKWQATLETILTWFEGELRANSTNGDLLHGRAVVQGALERYDDAIASLQGAELNSTADKKWLRLNDLAVVFALHRPKDPENALSMINEAIRLAGPQLTLLDSRAMILTLVRKYDDALKDLNAAIGMESRGVFHFHQAVIYHRTGKFADRDRAADLARKAGLTRLQLHPLEWPDYEIIINGKP